MTDTHEQPETVEQRTVAFFADPGATTLLLKETIEKLIESLDVHQGIVDITTLAGVSIAQAFVNANVPFATLEYGQDPHYEQHSGDQAPSMSPELRAHAAAAVSSHLEELTNKASGVVYEDVADLGAVDANIVLVPGVSGHNTKLLDFNRGSLVGAVLTQLEEAHRDAVIIDAPERGLQPVGNGTYLRAIIHVQAGATQA